MFLFKYVNIYQDQIFSTHTLLFSYTLSKITCFKYLEEELLRQNLILEEDQTQRG